MTNEHSANKDCVDKDKCSPDWGRVVSGLSQSCAETVDEDNSTSPQR